MYPQHSSPESWAPREEERYVPKIDIDAMRRSIRTSIEMFDSMASNFDPTDDHGMRVAIEKMKELEKEFNVFYAEAKRLSTVVGGYNILLNTKETKPLIERGVQLKERGLELHQQALFAFDEARVALDDPMRKALNEE